MGARPEAMDFVQLNRPQEARPGWFISFDVILAPIRNRFHRLKGNTNIRHFVRRPRRRRWGEKDKTPRKGNEIRSASALAHTCPGL
jgi:hypothetical protein